ncbi:LysR family transcriptional regulator [Hydrogenophaga crocea]|uniref:LysR family transcriptional regulator n=1 Tax=Hydrogenophaga crocea TaxID=2716225 RepID=A0A6G8IHJ8_9BURK|nr:LysR family transcriptional regulator substrate-binding protein [Hydrogenophaga crocea]QIM52528.1 LysR family transcriptional regulator [Hydrogenophaga crocea]
MRRPQPPFGGTRKRSPTARSAHARAFASARTSRLLVVRGRKRAELTPAGEVLVREGRKLLAARDELMDRVQRRASGREGVVRVGVSAGVSTRLLPMALEALGRSSPGVEVKLEAVGSAEAMRRLTSATLDIGIVASPQPPMAEVSLTPWRNDPMVALLPASWNAPERVTPDWLVTRRWASFAPATQMHGLVAAWFGQAGYHPRPYLTLSYPGALKSLAAASQSAALLPLEEVQDQLDAPGVQVRHLHPRLMRPMALAHRRLATPDPAVDAVLKVLVGLGD